MSENIPLVKTKQNIELSGLSVFFATLCIVDLFGVFPIVALPKAIIECGFYISTVYQIVAIFIFPTARQRLRGSDGMSKITPDVMKHEDPSIIRGSIVDNYQTYPILCILGWLGIPLAMTVLGLQVYTAMLLGRCWLMAEDLDPKIVSKSRYPYAALAEMTFGTTSSYLVTFLLDMAVFGGSIPNLLVASQNLQILGLKLTDHEVNFSYCYWMLILGVCLCPIMWLGSPKDLKWLAVSSVGIVLLVSILTWKSILKDTPSQPPEIPSPSWENVAIAYGIIAFQFDIHPVILTVQVDMLNKRKLGHALFAAFCVTGSLFMITTLLGFFTYGNQLRYNLLQGLPPSDILYLDVLLVTMQICLSMVVSGTALFQDVEDKLGISRAFSWRRCLVRSGLILFAVLIGESVPRFDLVMGLIGGALTGPLTFILPPLFYARLRAMQPQPEFICTSYQKYNPDSNQVTILDLPKTVDEYEQWYSADEITSDKELNRKITYYGTEPNVTSVKNFEQSSLGGIMLFRDRISDIISLDNYPAIGPMTFWERVVTIVIVLLGVTATVLSTYYTLIDTIRYSTFIPPCLVNISIASTLVDLD